MSKSRWVTNKERSRMRALVSTGMTRRAVGALVGRHEMVVWTHTSDILRPTVQRRCVQDVMRSRAQRIERLFRACNRVADLKTAWEACR